MQQAELFAGRLSREADTDVERIRLAYRLCYGREPSPQDVADAVAFIEARGLTLFCRAVLNSNEFLFLP